ncbi:MAG: hypothetical protein EOO62_15125 [Hymenobacter sp.]|nr:MAG: hypothetical protein EOO62_15125 [Hymenobacter sp.]
MSMDVRIDKHLVNNELLRHFSDQEQQLYQYAASLQGTMEDKAQHLRESGVFAAYRQLHTQYLVAFHAAADDASRLELLKRLTFINWYHLAEPSCFTGIDDLDEATIRAVYALLDEYLRHDKLDAELRWMLAYYASWEYTILTFIDEGLTALPAFVQEHASSSAPAPYHQLPKHSMDHRGQLGKYWQAVGVEVAAG